MNQIQNDNNNIPQNLDNGEEEDEVEFIFNNEDGNNNIIIR